METNLKPNLCTARLLVQAARAAYDRATIVGRKTDTQVLIEETPDFTIAAIRGTKEVQDWITDLKIGLRNVGGGMRVHDGFADAGDDVLPDLKNLHPERPLFIGGHSLGAAVGKYVAYNLWLNGFNVQAVYTFGEPRTGDAKWKSEYDKALGGVSWSFINPNDLVPLLPFYHWRYRRPGARAYLKARGGITINMSVRRFIIADLFAIWRKWRRGRAALLIGHHIDCYCEKVSLLK